MMRQPSEAEELLQWHTEYMAGFPVAVHDGLPECGWYKTQLVKDGPWTPVVIWCEQHADQDTGELLRDEKLIADVFGDEMDAVAIWHWLTPISREEYDRLYQWRLKSQHRLDSKKAVDVAAAPTLPKG
ncbi:MAG: hypothetical protein AAGA63_09935 [Pseudomonadota bacterium]